MSQLHSANFLWRREAYFEYGKILMALDDIDGALNAFNSALGIEHGKDKIPKEELILYRGLARKDAGKSGFLKDWRIAAEMGSARAKSLLKEHTCLFLQG